MRRLVFPIIVASGLVIVGAVPASAEDASTTSTAKAAAGKKVCKVTDPLLNELSGIVATDDGYIAVNDSSTSDEKKKIFLLSSKCAIKDSVSYSGDGPGDPEDLVLSPDGETLWIADIGDNAIRNDELTPRATIALWSMPADLSEKPKIHRLAYPEGDKHDAETLLFDGDGKPLIVTKEVSGAAQIYKPTAALKTGNKEGVPLAKVGTVELPRTDTAGTPFAKLAQSVATGGAVAPGGGKVVIRSYLAAYEWDVTGGDVVAALKKKPRATGLPNEPFGEAISYTPDGKNFVTVSDIGSFTSDPPANYILRYTPATEVVKAAADKGGTGAGDGKSWYSDLTLSDITWLVAGVGIVGLLLVGAGVLGIVRHRKKHPAEAPAALKDDADDDLPSSPKPADAATELLTVGGPPAGTYGAAAASGPVYGAKQQGKGVYGGG
ncbi:hypothetical protein, partial [Actinoplanes sp. RD1]|uniref:hypothetical protein n=1 Tax=Actinoplanes sp. RD1 TaxID=3064538 RepID=UPI002742348D